MIKTEPDVLKASPHSSDKLPKRDWIVLPLIGAVTIFVLIALTELTARRLLPKLPTMGEQCMVFDDPATGARGIPNSVCRDKLPDTEYAEYRFNDCGHRTPIACGVKPQGAYRIVMVGASFATGMRVPVEKTFATLLPEELSRRTGRAVQLYNESMPGRMPRVIAAHIDEALATKPDLLLWVVDPNDIGETSKLVREGRGNAHRSGGVVSSARAFISSEAMNQSTGSLLRVLLYHIRTLYVRNFLMRRDDSDFLKLRPGPEWEVKMKHFESYAEVIQERARASGVPVAVTLLPNRAQAAMLSMGSWPEGSDPYKTDTEVRAILAKHGAIFLDVVPGFRDVAYAENYFYPIDGHPDARGHALITRMLADALMGSTIAEFHGAEERADKRN